MKKILVVICVLIASYGYAQDVKFGAKAGLNLSNLVGDDVDDVDMKAGLYFGGFLNLPLNNNLSFQPELLYSRQGWKIDSGDGDLSIKTTYINIPLLLKMSLGASDKIHVYAGPQLGFLVKAEAQAEQGDVTGTVDIKDEFKDFDFSLNFGLSFDVSDEISLDVRYNRGLSKLDDIDNSKAYNSVIQLGVAYSF
ncbi:PorT family protein [Ancylomarina salipaludis]|uniref:PorT family protein n=1 Tax=Ancylomarina salipaludis TaxID=2501299 RepID=A0A4Q1JRU0_9BACT|nr:porin family protein [Ancylomarina salipaludis]RXQ97611.1 PorT family protein [Ancylomarina salipaludis]